MVVVSSVSGGGLRTFIHGCLAPGFAGLYQVNFQVDAGETPGVELLSISILGVESNQVPLYVQ